MTCEIETFKDTPLKNHVEALELLECILWPFHITLDDDILQNGGERSYTFTSPSCGLLRVLVLYPHGAMPSMAIVLEDIKRPIMYLAMDRTRVLMRQGQAEVADVISFTVVRMFPLLLEWVRDAVQRFFEQRNLLAY